MKRICENGLWGAVDANGATVIPCVYERFEKFVCRYMGYGNIVSAWVCREGKWGLIDRAGKPVIPLELDEQKWDWVRKGDKWALLYQETAESPLSFVFEEITRLRYGSGKAKRNGKWGVLSNTGKVIVPFAYDEIRLMLWYGLGRGFAQVRQDDRWGMWDGFGEMLLPCEYDFIGHFHNGVFRVKKSGKWGYVNRSGQIVVPLVYDHALDFCRPEGWHRAIARVRKNGSWGALREDLSVDCPCRYEKLHPVEGTENAGCYYVWADGKLDMVDWNTKWR